MNREALALILSLSNHAQSLFCQFLFIYFFKFHFQIAICDHQMSSTIASVYMLPDSNQAEKKKSGFYFHSFSSVPTEVLRGTQIRLAHRLDMPNTKKKLRWPQRCSGMLCLALGLMLYWAHGDLPWTESQGRRNRITYENQSCCKNQASECQAITNTVSLSFG